MGAISWPLLAPAKFVIKDLSRGSRGAGRTNPWLNIRRGLPRALDKVDPVWARIRSEAEDVARREPELATFIYSTHPAPRHARSRGRPPRQRAARPCRRVRRTDPPGLCRRARGRAGDRRGVPRRHRRDRRPRSGHQPLHRAGALLQRLPRHPDASAGALAAGARAARISPIICKAARRRCSSATSIRRRKIGRGIFLDHATGLVVGETAVIEDDVSILHDVTLGGTGKEHGDRHPKIRHGVMIGAGAKILGNIEVGHCARIAAGSVVLKPVPQQRHGRRRAGQGGRRGRLPGAVAHHGPDALRHHARRLIRAGARLRRRVQSGN